MSKELVSFVPGSAVEVGFNPEVRQAIADFAEAANAEKEAKSRKASAEKVLRSALGKAEFGNVGGVPAFKLERRNRVDLKRDVLKSAFPEAFEAASYENPYDFVSLVK